MDFKDKFKNMSRQRSEQFVDIAVTASNITLCMFADIKSLRESETLMRRFSYSDRLNLIHKVVI